jgi:hypothetical protein
VKPLRLPAEVWDWDADMPQILREDDDQHHGPGIAGKRIVIAS